MHACSSQLLFVPAKAVLQAVALANAVNQCDLFQANRAGGTYNGQQASALCGINCEKVQALLRDRADPNGHSQSPGTPLLLEAACGSE